MSDGSVRSITDALAAPFDEKEIKWKPQMVKNNKCLAIAYVDVRVIEDRLDGVVGVENWQDSYEVLNDGSVVCRLAIRFNGEWVTKTDVGSPSEQPDGGDRLKAAFSDAMKRTAIKYGIGRYIYRLPSQWVDYDPAKKQIVNRPRLPDWANPAAAAKKPAAQNPAPAAKPPAAAPAPAPATNGHATGNGTPKPSLPADGKELCQRLQDFDAKLAAQKVCPRGALLAHVTQAGVKAGYSPNLTEWAGAAIKFAVDAVKEFDAAARAPKAPPATGAAWAKKFEQDAATALSMADVDDLNDRLNEAGDLLTDAEYKACADAVQAAYDRAGKVQAGK